VSRFARRRFPFAAPATFWRLAVGLLFGDGHVVTFVTSVFVLVMAASSGAALAKTRRRPASARDRGEDGAARTARRHRAWA
jgi:hypothetical protein